MILDLIYNFTIIVPIILSVALLTLLERKVMASIQRRRGPSLVGFFGVLQPFADAFKLIFKETIIPVSTNFLLFLLSAILIFALSLLNWVVFPFSSFTVIADIHMGLFFIYLLSSLGVYGIIISGWASNSKYAFLGSLRAVAQMISYEISIGTLFLSILLVTNSGNLSRIVTFQKGGFLFFPLFPVFLIFFISILAETNRVPFDLPESESELVSGYNVEYSSITFAFFFLAEYSNIILMSGLIVILFFGGWLPFFNFLMFFPPFFFFYVKIFSFLLLFILIRASVPRYRYDQLMKLGWKLFLPLSFFLFFFFSFSLYFFSVI